MCIIYLKGTIMTTIHVSTKDAYDIHIGGRLLAAVGEIVRPLTKATKIAVVSDDTVFPLYGEKCVKSLEKSGFTVVSYVFPHGEHSKSHETLIKLYNFLSESGITRTDALAALGGGVVGDLTGFAAASFLRGIDFVQIPTTLLAQVDSSIGGKTGVNIEAGKNLVGAFKQPLAVIADTDTLSTLTDEIFSDGMGEVVKYGMIGSAELFELLCEGKAKANIDRIINYCAQCKSDIVSEDEKETGRRTLLNFGHTLGHAIEKHCGFGGISHGKAVAIGMALITARTEALGITKAGVTARLIKCLEANGLPVGFDIGNDALYTLSLGDKKRTSDSINLVFCTDIGKSTVQKMSLAEYEKFVKE